VATNCVCSIARAETLGLEGQYLVRQTVDNINFINHHDICTFIWYTVLLLCEKGMSPWSDLPGFMDSQGKPINTINRKYFLIN